MTDWNSVIFSQYAILLPLLIWVSEENHQDTPRFLLMCFKSFQARHSEVQLYRPISWHTSIAGPLEVPVTLKLPIPKTPTILDLLRRKHRLTSLSVSGTRSLEAQTLSNLPRSNHRTTFWSVSDVWSLEAWSLVKVSQKIDLIHTQLIERIQSWRLYWFISSTHCSRIRKQHTKIQFYYVYRCTYIFPYYYCQLGSIMANRKHIILFKNY